MGATPSSRDRPRHPGAVRAWLIWWALLAALWLALVDTVAAPELVAGAVAAAIAATGAVVVRGQRRVLLRPRAAWVRHAAGPLRRHGHRPRPARGRALAPRDPARATSTGRSSRSRTPRWGSTRRPRPTASSPRRSARWRPNTLVVGVDADRRVPARPRARAHRRPGGARDAAARPVNGWLWAAAVLVAALVPLTVVCVRLPAPEGVVALEAAGVDAVLALLLIAQGTAVSRSATSRSCWPSCRSSARSPTCGSSRPSGRSDGARRRRRRAGRRRGRDRRCSRALGVMLMRDALDRLHYVGASLLGSACVVRRPSSSPRARR